MGARPHLKAAGIYHVTTQAVDGAWLFITDADYLMRLELVATAVQKKMIVCHMFCLMGTHEHLLATVEDEALPTAMQFINRGYAGTFNQAHGRRGRLYSKPYSGTLIESERQFFNTFAYVALNPELVNLGRAEEYRWSSVPSLLGGRAAIPWVDERPIIDLFGGGPNVTWKIVEFLEDSRARKHAV